MVELRSIDAAGDLHGKRVLLRASLNVPVSASGSVGNDYRLVRAQESMRFLHEKGAITLIIGHIGRDPEDTLEPVCKQLGKVLPITFLSDIHAVAASFASAEPGAIFLLENLRRHPEESGNDAEFARTLASFADIYVADAFSDAHRAHASIVGVPALLPSYAGFLLLDEVAHLRPAFSPEHPSLFILGGAKFETKVPLVRKFLDTYDHVFIGGALAHDVFKAKGWNIGKSLASSETLNLADVVNHPHLMLPVDVVVERSDQTRVTKGPQEVADDDIILDAGPETVALILDQACAAAFVLWNGPLGNYERGYNEQTEALARGLAEITAATVVGGGDTVASISSLGLFEKYQFVSTGGGAMLEFLQNGTLPGIEALTDSKLN